MADWDDPAKSLKARWIIVKGRWKLVDSATARGKCRVFRPAVDPHESKDLAADNADTVRRLRERLGAWWKQEAEPRG